VQVKSNLDDFIVKGTQRDAFLHSSIPIFVAVVDRAAQTLEVFSTLDRHALPRNGPPVTVGYEWGPERASGLRPTDRLAIGAAISTMDLALLDQPDVQQRDTSRRSLLRMLRSWSDLDAVAIGNVLQNIPMILRPKMITADPDQRVDRENWEPLYLPWLEKSIVPAVLNAADRYCSTALRCMQAFKGQLGDESVKRLWPLVGADGILQLLRDEAESLARERKNDPPCAAP
jgi:hypothetical protein